MKTFNWDTEKNLKLKAERGISFEEVLLCIENGQVVDVLEHPNQSQYGGQKLYVIIMHD